MNTRKNCFYSILLALLFISNTSVVFGQKLQNKAPYQSKTIDDSVVMTWNKNTPESEMKEDVIALKKHGVTIEYWDVKRNRNNEITAVSLSYTDKNGNYGELKINHQNPIQTITFYKNGNQMGFGNPSQNNDLTNFFFNGMPNQNHFKSFGFRDEDGNPSEDNFREEFSAESLVPKMKKKSKIIIKKPNKADLIIENGEVISGKEDYSEEEIEKIKKENQFNSDELSESDFGNLSGEFDLRDEKGVQEFKRRINKMITPDENENDLKSELSKAKEEMIKAKEDLEKARIALEKTLKSSTKQK